MRYLVEMVSLQRPARVGEAGFHDLHIKITPWEGGDATIKMCSVIIVCTAVVLDTGYLGDCYLNYLPTCSFFFLFI